MKPPRRCVEPGYLSLVVNLRVEVLRKLNRMAALKATSTAELVKAWIMKHLEEEDG